MEYLNIKSEILYKFCEIYFQGTQKTKKAKPKSFSLHVNYKNILNKFIQQYLEWEYYGEY